MRDGSSVVKTGVDTFPLESNRRVSEPLGLLQLGSRLTVVLRETPWPFGLGVFLRCEQISDINIIKCQQH
jgi:hypothetical protein